MPFQDALKMRLDCMNASKLDIESFRKEHPPKLSPGAASIPCHCNIATPGGIGYCNHSFRFPGCTLHCITNGITQPFQSVLSNRHACFSIASVKVQCMLTLGPLVLHQSYQ